MRRPVNRSDVDRLVLEHLGDALRLARRLSGDPQVAEDVVQDALVNVLRNWRTFRADASFRTWMMRIVVNAHRGRARRRRPHATLPDELAACSNNPPQEAIAAESAARVRRAIERLPPRQREVAAVCLGEGASAREAAQILKTTEANIYATLHLVRQRLAAALGVKASNFHE